ncbi:MAG: hypothetical protein IKQ54_05360 [Oscillospiraceae bacterium]|nr:hypothetical protein [Oscillospiraceae bacterium]MBR4193738.1 hypothetical protein [Oscillospiraceae bacterium]
MATFIKVHDRQEELVGVEILDPPGWVRQLRNGTVELCDRESQAQGVQDSTGSVIYQLAGRQVIDDPNIELVATIITEAEYDELAPLFPDHPPDPDVPDPEPEPVDPGDGSMSNAELTAAVQALTEELAAAKIMLGVE